MDMECADLMYNPQVCRNCGKTFDYRGGLSLECEECEDLERYSEE